MGNVKLTAQDRCDRCGAQAYAAATLSVGGQRLLFCAHHSREHLPALRIRFPAAKISDETSELAAVQR